MDKIDIFENAIEDNRLSPIEFRIYCMICMREKRGLEVIGLPRVNKCFKPEITNREMRSILSKLDKCGYIKFMFVEYLEDEANFYHVKLIRQE